MTVLQGVKRATSTQRSNVFYYSYREPIIDRIVTEEGTHKGHYSVDRVWTVLNALGPATVSNGGSFGRACSFSDQPLPNDVLSFLKFELIVLRLTVTTHLTRQTVACGPMALGGAYAKCEPERNADVLTSPTFDSEFEAGATKYSDNKVVCNVALKSGSVVVAVDGWSGPKSTLRGEGRASNVKSFEDVSPVITAIAPDWHCNHHDSGLCQDAGRDSYSTHSSLASRAWSSVPTLGGGELLIHGRYFKSDPSGDGARGF